MRRGWALALLLLGCPKERPTDPGVAERAWQPAPPPADDVIYFVMVDRFANGDPSNDGVVDPADPTAFHGGDLQGVIGKLDYLQGLGVRTLWLSPVFSMRTEKFYDWGAFHGYWVHDLRSVEPRFGDEAALRELSDALHARGMRLLLDVVWNHVAMDAPLQAEHPGWFHPRVGIEDWDDPVELVTREVHGLPDFAQEDPEAYAYLRDASLRWVRAARPDGFRVDAVRHMPSEFLARIGGELEAEAGPGFFLLGEDFQGDPVALAETWEAGGFDTMFDFPLHYAMLDVFCDDRHPGRLAAMLSGDGAYPDAQRLVTFLDNHDLPRIATRCHGDLARVRRALAFQLTTRGIPSITWGLEAGLEGEGEPANRADMVFDSGYPLEADIRALLEFRRRHPALLEGGTAGITSYGGTASYLRVGPEERAKVFLAGPWELPEEAWYQPEPGGELLVVDDALRFPEPLADGSWEPIPIRPGLLVVEVGPAGDQTAVLPGAARVPCRVTVADLSLAEGDQLVLTGSGRALGNWNPAEPAGVFAAVGDALVLELDLPSDAVLELKLVIRHADGSVTWQEGENRYLWASGGVTPAENGPLGLSLSWTEP